METLKRIDIMIEEPYQEAVRRATRRRPTVLAAGLLGFVLLGGSAWAQENEDCLVCHSDKDLTTKRAGRTVSLFVDESVLAQSTHEALSCVSCHQSLEGQEFPHDTPVGRVACGTCHEAEQELYSECRHGKAASRGDPLAPLCQDCHGRHDILPVADHRSAVAPLQVPFVCGRCHREGAPVQLQRVIGQDRILENYSESIHGEGLLKKGLVVSPTCASCHTAHRILPHTDERSSIARGQIAATCSQCHAEIEAVHQKIIKGELWEKEASVLPACVDCHQPHKIRKVFYVQGMADADCLRCHERESLTSADGRSLFVNPAELAGSRHNNVTCSQCHTGVRASLARPCRDLTAKVDCASCHAAIGEEFLTSTHGLLSAREDQNAPTCLECHGTHKTLGRLDPESPTFALNIPALCARCHREGEKAAVRYAGNQHEITDHYAESIHGKGLLESGLVVTATCTDCHTAHHELPGKDAQSSVNPDNISATCGRCHHGIQDQFSRSVHAKKKEAQGAEVPKCSDCHSAHTIRRTDADGFKLEIMGQCGRCHTDIAKTYFDTYHGKVSQLGFTKTAKCYDCHGAHDILPVSDPESRLSRENVIGTCRTCHPGATRRFAGYLTHATHHDPDKYPFLFWTFWGMTGLLVGTFFLSGVHTLLWLPRALSIRRQRKKRTEAALSGDDSEEPPAPPPPESEHHD